MLNYGQPLFTFPELYEEIKYWGPIVGAGIGAYKIFDWVKKQFASSANDIKQSVTMLGQSMHATITSLDNNTKTQTSQVVGELKELRSDIRTFYGPMAIAAAVPPKPTTKTRKTNKSRSAMEQAAV